MDSTQHKQTDYNKAPAGLPLVEHALQTLFDHVKQGRLSLEQVVEKTAHNPALRYNINNRGYIREGYFADLALIDLKKTHSVSHDNVRYHCGWTPFHGHTFSSTIEKTWVNGALVYANNLILDQSLPSMQLEFNK